MNQGDTEDMTARPPSSVAFNDERTKLLPEMGNRDGNKLLSRGAAYIPHGFNLLFILIIVSIFTGVLLPLVRRGEGETLDPTSLNDGDQGNIRDSEHEVPCTDDFCFRPEKIHVSTEREGFPSFWNYRGPMNVTYDSRSIVINSERALFLSGSMHPSRATKATWEAALVEAVRNGLNMVTIYIMWAAHQPLPHREIDWSLPGQPECEIGDTECQWDLAGSIRAAADRGLFVHIRVGPYVCAEYNYGGIPEWVALDDPNIAMRRPNRVWMTKMKIFVSETVAYLTAEQLWAYQGGPIVLAQIENELGGEVDASSEHLVMINSENRVVDEASKNKNALDLRNATLQDYADWCGSLAAELAPEVVWTMCNGLSARNTISTFNGNSGVDWLESRGDSGRIQVDQPALWTEDEGGFQIWGDEANAPSDYFWGQTARSMSFQALRWFARGGTHLNYYMFWGGYNRGRSSAAGIMNAYASDACICPSGQRRQPKYGHMLALHEAITQIAPILLRSDTALFKDETVQIRSEDGVWVEGPDQRMFRYQNIDTDLGMTEVIFVENDANVSQIVKVPTGDSEEAIIVEMEAYSAVLVVDNVVSFDSATVQPRSQSFRRKIVNDAVTLLDRTSWKEPVGAADSDPRTQFSIRPQEQTALMLNSKLLSDYAWYETDFVLDTDLDNLTLFVDTQKATAILAFVDDKFVGWADDHKHAEGNVTLNMTLGHLSRGPHKLSLLSESLGYFNLIGRWGASTKAKPKGLTGDVVMFSPNLGRNVSLVDGRTWRSLAGLHGERLVHDKKYLAENLNLGRYPCSWTSIYFDTPRYDPTIQGLLLDISTGRGHFWLNGRDLGRYWNITRGGTDELSQRYYFLPNDYLYKSGRLNELVFFDAFGGDLSEASLVLSWIEATDEPNFMDEVDYPLACI